MALQLVLVTYMKVALRRFGFAQGVVGRFGIQSEYYQGKNVRNNVLMCYQASRLIILCHQAEKSGTIEPMTIADLDFKTRAWLREKVSTQMTKY